MTVQEHATAVAKTELVPIDPKEPHWIVAAVKKSVEALRKYGNYLIPGYYQARVKQEESRARQIDAEAQARLLEAQGRFAKTIAEAKKIMSDARYVDAITEGALPTDVERIVTASDLTPQQAMEQVRYAIQSIEFDGGRVETDVIDAEFQGVEDAEPVPNGVDPPIENLPDVNTPIAQRVNPTRDFPHQAA